jgi:hypothetical protein
VKAHTGKEKASALKGAATTATSVSPTLFAPNHPRKPSQFFPFWNRPSSAPYVTGAPNHGPRGTDFLIANLELEFPATARKQSFGEDSNRKYFAILERERRLCHLGWSLGCPEKGMGSCHDVNRLSRQLEFRASH